MSTIRERQHTFRREVFYRLSEQMEPRYQQRWLLHVNPFEPPTRGRDVVVYKTDQAVLIKGFVRWDGDELVLQQLNPACGCRAAISASVTSSSASTRRGDGSHPPEACRL